MEDQENITYAMLITEDRLRIIINESLDSRIEQLEQIAKGNPTPDKLSRLELKERYKLSYPTIHNLMNNGMPFIKIGRRTFYDTKIVDEWLNENGAWIGK